MESDYFSGDVLYRDYRIRYQSNGKELTLFLDYEQSKDLVYEKNGRRYVFVSCTKQIFRCRLSLRYT